MEAGVCDAVLIPSGSLSGLGDKKRGVASKQNSILPIEYIIVFGHITTILAVVWRTLCWQVTEVQLVVPEVRDDVKVSGV